MPGLKQQRLTPHKKTAEQAPATSRHHADHNRGENGKLRVERMLDANYRIATDAQCVVNVTRGGPAADFRNRASEGCPGGLECRRRAGRTCLGAHAPATSDRMHSRRKGELKTQGIKSSFLRDAKNCLTRYVRNYSVRSACGLPGKPTRAESWGPHPSWNRNVTDTT